MSQNEAILRELRRGRKLTPHDIYRLCGSLAGHSRISELRDKGHRITCRMVERNGKRVGLYAMGRR